MQCRFHGWFLQCFQIKILKIKQTPKKTYLNNKIVIMVENNPPNDITHPM